MDEIKNIIVCGENETTLVYVLTLTVEEVRKWCEAAKIEGLTDVYEVKQDELQYYCIDSRVWADTPKEEQRVRSLISKM